MIQYIIVTNVAKNSPIRCGFCPFFEAEVGAFKKNVADAGLGVLDNFLV